MPAETLPSLAVVAKTTSPTDRSVSSDSPLTVLVVEDEPSVAMLETEILERAGYRVQQVTLGRRALELLESEPIVAIVADYTMPDMTGADFVTALREWSEVPVIGVTGHADPAVERQMRDAGVTGFLVKDPGLDFLTELPKAVAAALATPVVSE